MQGARHGADRRAPEHRRIRLPAERGLERPAAQAAADAADADASRTAAGPRRRVAGAGAADRLPGRARRARLRACGQRRHGRVRRQADGRPQRPRRARARVIREVVQLPSLRNAGHRGRSGSGDGRRLRRDRQLGRSGASDALSRSLSAGATSVHQIEKPAVRPRGFSRLELGSRSPSSGGPPRAPASCRPCRCRRSGTSATWSDRCRRLETCDSSRSKSPM